MADIDQEELEHLREQVVDAIRQMRGEIRWKPGKDIEHLQTRIGYGHLPAKADLDDYESIVSAILHEPAADVYVFVWQDDAYPTVVAEHDGERWLVMFSLSGLMEPPPGVGSENHWDRAEVTCHAAFRCAPCSSSSHSALRSPHRLNAQPLPQLPVVHLRTVK